MMGFPENLKQARLAKGKKQKEIADYLKVTPSTYCGYESGKRTPDIAKVQRIATFLEVPLESLIGTVSFDSGNDFDAAWKKATDTSGGPGYNSVTVYHKPGGEIQILDHRKEHLNQIYDQLDDNRQGQLVKYGEFLLSDSENE